MRRGVWSRDRALRFRNCRRDSRVVRWTVWQSVEVLRRILLERRINLWLSDFWSVLSRLWSIDIYSPQMRHRMRVEVVVRGVHRNALGSWSWACRVVIWTHTRPLQPREVAFIELCSFADDDLPAERIVEFPALVAVWIADEDAFLHVRGEAMSLVLLDVNVGCAAPNAEVGDVRLATIPHLKRRGLGTGSRVRAVEHMDKGQDSLAPERLREPRLCQHRRDAVGKDPVGPLCNTVLLGAVAHGVLTLDAVLLAARAEPPVVLCPAYIAEEPVSEQA